jgi:hypothetical protein
MCNTRNRRACWCRGRNHGRKRRRCRKTNQSQNGKAYAGVAGAARKPVGEIITLPSHFLLQSHKIIFSFFRTGPLFSGRRILLLQHGKYFMANTFVSDLSMFYLKFSIS